MLKKQAWIDDPFSLATTLAWYWVIEYLASFPEIEALILHGMCATFLNLSIFFLLCSRWVVEVLCCVQFVIDLIEAAPKMFEDLRKNIRKMVALRFLEDFFFVIIMESRMMFLLKNSKSHLICQRAMKMYFNQYCKRDIDIRFEKG
ncbi:hypothetical protein POTOM_024840 [Populus tomentosa]|uniref:Uncharacterized protein n=1 Tax=Populus tomentosa TaxID=118781 RepID=A0A8X7ZD00_POPTO|nr:hypothetical protein POTOM_024840 [Populus tomentosa]